MTGSGTSIETASDDCIDVVAAVLRDDKGNILLTQRRQGTHLEGLWEFPGGKVEASETHAVALHRELSEELGIQTGTIQPLIQVSHQYPEKKVRLHIYDVLTFSGQAHGREGQVLQWCDMNQLQTMPMPAADHPVIQALRLPKFYPITGAADSDRQWLEYMESLSDHSLIQFRAKELDIDHQRQRLEQVLSETSLISAQIMLNGPVAWVQELDLAGVHLTSHKLMSLSRRPVSEQYWVAASCHNLEEIKQAEAIGVDFICLSPVLKTDSHPDATVMRFESFAKRAAATNLPVYGLGGLAVEDLKQVINCGGQGIAGISAFWVGV